MAQVRPSGTSWSRPKYTAKHIHVPPRNLYLNPCGRPGSVSGGVGCKMNTNQQLDLEGVTLSASLPSNLVLNSQLLTPSWAVLAGGCSTVKYTRLLTQTPLGI
ncbi:hypothetical protein BT67DRAFT_307130 [Trichocladium antarcticum]|uniref:Uncharacterized protein n=1 Tax=Trichocladium antarcticum TaxID=1450529 RepID=A0AAN6ZDA3_9PEZI|nr:hypothetical protein BT67DRAFT_307130 [Trichocladium antarcticum]